MSDISDQVQMAIRAGYTPAQIADHLSQKPQYSNKFAQARNAGYTDDDIIMHLGGPQSTVADHSNFARDQAQNTKQTRADEAPTVAGAVARGLGDAGETALNLGTAAIATPISGLAGISQGIQNTYDRAVGNSVGMSAADRVAQVGNAMTYSPRLDESKDTQAIVQKPFEMLAAGGDKAGQFASDVTGSPLIGAAVNTGVQALPAVLMKKAGGVRINGAGADASTAASAAEATARAKEYATKSAGLDWDSLTDGFKQKLASAATNATNLENLDPAAVAREARLDALGLKGSRGQVTRNLAQLTSEENITKGDSGQPIRDLNATQDEVLHNHLDTLRGDTGSTVTTRQGLGKSVQGAARSKAATLEADYHDAYDAAKAQGETMAPADISPLQDWLKNPTNARNAGYLKSAISDYIRKDGMTKNDISINSTPDEIQSYVDDQAKKNTVSINDLEEIRKEATANRAAMGPASHYAGQAVKVIDGILDNSGGDAYQTARGKFKAYNDEFERQGGVAKLVGEKGQTSDRQVALEDTLDHVLKSPVENITDIKKSLTEGGTAKTQAQGAQSWKDIQAGVLDFLKEKAAGKRAIVGDTSTDAGQRAFNNKKELLQFNSSFRDAFSELDKDGKIDAIFDPPQAAKLRQIYDAVGDLRTKPTGRVSGSDSVPRALAMLEEMSKPATKIASLLPMGDIAVGLATRLRNVGKDTAAVREAQTTPLNEIANARAPGSRTRAAAKAIVDKAPYLPLSQVTAQWKDQ